MSLINFDSGRGLRCVLGAALVALSMAAAGSAVAQQQGGDKGAPPAGMTAKPSTNPWFKLCTKNKVANDQEIEQCLTTLEVRDDESAQILVSVSVLINKSAPEGTKDVVLFVAPVGVFLPPGLEAQIDDQPVQKVPFMVCSPQNCLAQIEATDEIIEKLKKGSELKIAVVNPRRQKVSFPVTLSGFTNAFDGQPMSREEYEKRQQALDSKIREFIEKRREQIEDAQKKQQEQQGEDKK